MLENLGYQGFCVGKYILCVLKTNFIKQDGVAIVFITSVYCVLFVVIIISLG